MAGSEYATVGGGALKLKGAKITKPSKKKKKQQKSKTLDKALVAATTTTTTNTPGSPTGDKTLATDPDPPTNPEQEEDEDPIVHKTEAELRHEEAQRKKLAKLMESSGSRPDLLKTHKERVEELNTYLSKLSEHHDMPKIGPG